MSKTYYIPNAPKNLTPLFPTINWIDVDEYFIQVLDEDDAIIMSSTMNKLDLCDDYVRIHFLNSLGCIDAINFNDIQIIHDSKSDLSEQATTYPLIKSTHGLNRINIKSNDSYIVKSIDYGEQQQSWIDELLDAPVAWLEWVGTQGQPDDYIPIVISDIKRDKRKVDERYIYELQLEFKLSHEKINLRN